MFISDRTHKNPRRGCRLKQFEELKGAYVKIPNELLRDNTISWKAKGLFCWMASNENTFTFTAKSIARDYPDGRAAILGGMQELKETGWITYIKKGNGYGKYLLNTTIKPQSEILTLDKTVDNKPKFEKQTMGAEPKFENPKLDNRTVRKPNRINKTNSLNKTNLYKSEDKKISENNQKQEQERISALSAIKQSTDQVLENIRTGVLNANRQQS